MEFDLAPTSGSHRFDLGLYGPATQTLPPYLQAQHYDAVRARAGRVEVEHANFVERLQASADASLDRYVLLDAQDWMNNAQLDDLWARITRASRPGARVLFRTAAEPSLLPGRLDDAILGKWRYLAETSADCTRRDRSSIYGGVHVYELA